MLLSGAGFKSMRFAAPLSAAAAFLLLGGCGSGVRSATASGVPLANLVVSAAPRLGYSWSGSDKTLRPIDGVPGAARFGDSVTPAGTYGVAEADPTGTAAVLIDATQRIYTMSLPGGSPVLTASKATAGSRIVFSPSGAWAFVSMQGETQGTLLTRLSGAAVARSVTFAAPLDETVVSDTGSVAASLRGPGGSSVSVVTATGTLSLPALATTGGLAFVAGTEDLLLLDTRTNALVRVRSASTSPAASVLATAEPLKAPIVLATSKSARWAVAASAVDGSVVRIDLSGSTPARRTMCHCQPSVVAPLSNDGTFRLTALQDGPVWISEAAKADFPVLFIPALPSQAKGVTR